MIPILLNTKARFWHPTAASILLLIGGAILFSLFCMFVGSVLSKRWPPLWQFVKFGATGAMNFSVDVGILNLLSLLTGIYAGLYIILLNSASVAVSVLNSYVWNKLWTFESREKFNWAEFGRFILISIGGIIVNSGLVYILTTPVGPLGNFSPAVWENISKLIATAFSLTVTFSGYKLFVFKPKSDVS